MNLPELWRNTPAFHSWGIQFPTQLTINTNFYESKRDREDVLELDKNLQSYDFGFVTQPQSFTVTIEGVNQTDMTALYNEYKGYASYGLYSLTDHNGAIRSNLEFIDLQSKIQAVDNWGRIFYNISMVFKPYTGEI